MYDITILFRLSWLSGIALQPLWPLCPNCTGHCYALNSEYSSGSRPDAESVTLGLRIRGWVQYWHTAHFVNKN